MWMWTVYGLSSGQFAAGFSPTCTKFAKSNAQRRPGESIAFIRSRQSAPFSPYTPFSFSWTSVTLRPLR